MSNITRVSHKDFFNSPAVKRKFDEVVSGNSNQFVTSLLSVVNNNNLLSKADNHSIMTAALKAAVLNLPIEPSLGFAYIVPYKNQAQFQLGYKGLIQLAIRSGQFKGINAGKVHKSQFVSYDPLFETLEVDFKQPADEVVGYFATFELVNGFKKLTYWSKDEVLAHAKRFSKTFNNGPWKTDFDAMAQKTAIKDILSKYAPLSVEMQDAITADNADAAINDRQAKDITPEPAVESINDLIGPPVVDQGTGEILEGQAGATGYPEEDIPPLGEDPLEEQTSFFEGQTTNIKG